MKASVNLSCSFPISVKPHILRTMESIPPKMELSCTMDCWSLHFFHFGTKISILGEVVELRPGQALLTPIDTHTVSWYPGEHSLYFVHFLLSCSGNAEFCRAYIVVDMENDYPLLDAVFAGVVRDFRVSRDKAEVGLWYILQSLFVPRGDDAKVDMPHRLSAAISYIDEQIATINGVGQASEIAGISLRHLNRIFIEYFGVTVAVYIREKRLMLAKRYLESSDYLIKEIAGMVGVGSQQHFNNMIKKRFGMTPVQLRRQSKKHTGL